MLDEFDVRDDRRQRQTDFTENFLPKRREQNPIEPGHIPYPSGFIQRNAHAYEACQRDCGKGSSEEDLYKNFPWQEEFQQNQRAVLL